LLFLVLCLYWWIWSFLCCS